MTAEEKSDLTQALMFNKIMYQSITHFMFRLTHRLPSSLSDSVPEVTAASNQLKRTILCELVDFSRFGHCWKH